MQKTKVAIIGSGPAGYTAAIYIARAQLDTVVFTGLESGGQLMYTTELENFPGFPEGIMGPKFMMNLRQQAQRFEAKVIDGQVTAVDFSQRPFKLWTNLPDGIRIDDYKKMKAEEAEKIRQQIKQSPAAYEAKSVIIATGATAITLGIPGEEKFMGRGLSVCAVCDAAFFKDKKVFVIGGGDSAMEDALALTKFAAQVTIIHRRDKFRASKIMQQRVLNHPKITVLWNTQLKEVMGKSMVTKIKVETGGKVQELAAQGVFLAIGHRPATSLFAEQIDLSQKGYIVTAKSPSKEGIDKAQSQLNQNNLINYPTMTSVKGVFAAGDVVDARYQQAITAAGMGAAAALDAERWLDEQAS